MAVDGSIIIDTKIDLSNLSKNLKQMVKQVDVSLAQANKIANKALVGVTASITAMATATGVFIKSASKIEDAVANFTPLMKSTERAEKLVKELNKTASTTPFQFENIAKTAQRLLPSMNGDIQKTIDTFRLLGDTAGGNAQKLETITNGYSKALMKGKVDLEALNMIAEAGVPVIQEMADMLNISTAELYKMITAGQITSDQLTQTFQKMTSEGGIFYNGMEIASQTLTGKISTLRDNITMLSAKMGNDLLVSIKKTVDGFIELVQAQEGFEDFTNTVNKIIEDFNTWAFETGNLSKLISDFAGIIGFVLKNNIIQTTAVIGIAIKTIATLSTAFTGILGTVNLVALAVGGLVLAVTALNNAKVEKIEAEFGGVAESLGTTAKRVKDIGEEAEYWLGQGLSIEESIERTMELQEATREEVIRSLNANKWLTEEQRQQVGILMNQLVAQDKYLALNKKGAKRIADRTEAEKEEARIKEEERQKELARIREINKKYEDQFELVKNVINSQKSKSELLEEEIKQLETLSWETGSIQEQMRQQAIAIKKKELEEAKALEISSLQEIMNLKVQAEKLTSQQIADGFATQEEGLTNLLAMYQSMASTLYELGYISSEFGSDGDKALFDLLERIKTLKFEIGQLGQEAGEELPKTISRGIKEKMFEALGSVKKMTDTISETITRASKGDLAKASSGFLDVIGDIAEGVGKLYAGDTAGGIISLASGIGGAFTLIENLAKSFWNNLVALSKFSAAETLQGFEDVMNGLANFFGADKLKPVLNELGETVGYEIDDINKSAGELFQVSNIILAGEKLVNALWDGIEANKENIFTAIKNIMQTIFNVVSRNQGTITAITSFIMEIVTLIIQNLPLIIEAGFMILKAVGEGIMNNLDSLMSAVFGLITFLIEFIGDNLGDIITAGLMIIMAIVKGLLENREELTRAIIMIIPAILGAIVDNLPLIVEAWGELVPMMIASIITMFPSLIMIWVEFMLELVGVLVEYLAQIPAVWTSFFKGLVSGSIKGFNNLIDTIVDFAGKIAGAFMFIGQSAYEGFMRSFSAIKEVIDSVMSALATASGTVSGLTGGVSGAVSNVGSGISGAVGKVSSWLPSFDVGTPYVNKDMVAQIHRGEQILPRTFNQSLMSGETIMMNPKSFSSILQGLQGGMSNPSVNTLGNGVIKLIANIKGNIEVDGREIGRTAFQYVDTFAGVSYGS